MKMALIILSICLSMIGCSKMPSLDMTNTYVEVSKPGDRFGLVELEEVKLDSSFGYPAEEKELIAYTLVDRQTHKMITPNGDAKVYFNKKDAKYCWQVWPDIFSANKFYVDTIFIKPNTWYRVTSADFHWDLYFYIDAKSGTYIRKYKPFPEAY